MRLFFYLERILRSVQSISILSWMILRQRDAPVMTSRNEPLLSRNEEQLEMSPVGNGNDTPLVDESHSRLYFFLRFTVSLVSPLVSRSLNSFYLLLPFCFMMSASCWTCFWASSSALCRTAQSCQHTASTDNSRDSASAIRLRGCST